MVSPRDIPMAPHRYAEHKAIVEMMLSPLEVEILRAYPNKVSREGNIEHLAKLMERVFSQEGNSKLVQDAAVRIFIEDLNVTLSQHDDVDTIRQMIITRVTSYPKGWYQSLSIEGKINERVMALTFGEKCMHLIKKWTRG